MFYIFVNGLSNQCIQSKSHAKVGTGCLHGTQKWALSPQRQRIILLFPKYPNAISRLILSAVCAST